MAGTSIGMPAAIAAWRAVIWLVPEHLAHEHVVDLGGGHPGPGQRLGDGDRAQLDGRA
jgi:hypothetical protein